MVRHQAFACASGLPRDAVSLEHTDVAESDEEEDDSSDSSLDEVKESVDYLATHFRLPLDAKGIALATLQDEAENVVEYT